jgi:hypothetical protein
MKKKTLRKQKKNSVKFEVQQQQNLRKKIIFFDALFFFFALPLLFPSSFVLLLSLQKRKWQPAPARSRTSTRSVSPHVRPLRVDACFGGDRARERRGGDEKEAWRERAQKRRRGIIIDSMLVPFFSLSLSLTPLPLTSQPALPSPTQRSARPSPAGSETSTRTASR